MGINTVELERKKNKRFELIKDKSKVQIEMNSEKENKVTNRGQKANMNPKGSTLFKNSNSKI